MLIIGTSTSLSSTGKYNTRNSRDAAKNTKQDEEPRERVMTKIEYDDHNKVFYHKHHIRKTLRLHFRPCPQSTTRKGMSSLNLYVKAHEENWHACIFATAFAIPRYPYPYFQKRCRRERRMAVVERGLHDRKELWFPYLVCKNNEFFACCLTNGKLALA